MAYYNLMGLLAMLHYVMSIEVNTNCETYIGYQTIIKNKTIDVYEGIPYAKAPIRELRWKPSELRDCNVGQKINATVKGSSCIQMVDDVRVESESEDCLFLNIYVINRENQKKRQKDVLMYIHGGSAVIGNAFFQGEVHNLLLYDEDIIIVTIEYRLNIFGFFALEALREHDPRNSSGNYGITDQQTALKWIQKNIEFFGGNKSNVSLIGQSSGGTSIFALISSYDSIGLFSSAISLSGSPNITMNLDQAEKDHYKDIVENSKCNPKILKDTSVYACLMELNSKELVSLIPNAWIVDGTFCNDKHKGCQFPGLVIVDGKTVNFPLHEALEKKIVDVNLIIQVLEQELELFPTKEFIKIQNYSLNEFEVYLKKKFSGWKHQNPEYVGNRLLELYANEEKDTDILYNSMISDLLFTCGNEYIAHVAGSHLESNIYFNIVMQRPSHPIISPLPPYVGKLAFHDWDLMAGTDNFCVYFFKSNECPEYIPHVSDIKLGENLRSSWFSLIHVGVSMNLTPIRKRHAKHQEDILVNLYDKNQIIPIQNFTVVKCQELHKLGFDEKFWLTN